MQIEPIAFIYNDFTEKFGVPRQSGRVPVSSKIVFEPKYRNPDSLRGIEEFSHLWLIFDFSLSHREEFVPLVRPPRLGGNKKVGVFASRSPFRPNSMGLSCVELKRVETTEKEGCVLIVEGADLVNGTPIYDIKPYIPYADCIPEAKGSFAELNKNYSLEVRFPEKMLALIPPEKQKVVLGILADDPRPGYKDGDNQIYGLTFGDYNITFTVSDKTLNVEKIEKI